MGAVVDARPDGHEAIATEGGKSSIEGRTLKHQVGGQIGQGHAAAISLECTEDGKLRRGDAGLRKMGVIQPCQRPGRPPHDARGTGGLVDGVWMPFHYVAYATYDTGMMSVNSQGGIHLLPAQADISTEAVLVVEAGRPRALRTRGPGCESMPSCKPGLKLLQFARDFRSAGGTGPPRH